MSPLKKATIKKANYFAGLFAIIIFSIGCSSANQQGSEKYHEQGDISFQECRSGEISTWGEAPVFTSIDASRDKAKENACRKAIEKCIGEQVAKISGVSEGQSIASEIFSESKGICKNDQVIEEKEYMLDTVKMLRLFVKFKVQQVAIRDAIDTAQKLAGNPKVMILIREKYEIPGKKSEIFGYDSNNGTASAVLKDFLIEKGYEVIPGDMLNISSGAEKTLLNNGKAKDELMKTIQDKAAAAGADILVLGDLEINPQNISQLAGTDFKSMKATGNVRLLTLWGRSRELGVYTRQENGAGITHLAAAREAGHRYSVGSSRDWKQNPSNLAAFVTSKLKSEWARVTKENQILITIDGMEPRWAGIFRDDLIERTAVKKVYEQGVEANHVVWDVIYPGRAFSLADLIAHYGDNPGKFVVVQKSCRKISVKSVKRGAIHLEFSRSAISSGAGCKQ